MIIQILGYPQTFSFKTTKKLPKFKDACPVRGKLLVKEMELQDIDSPSHSYDEYVVELIETTKDGEIWSLGS